MNSKLIIIKVLETQDDIISRIDSSLRRKKECEYHVVNKKDKYTMDDLCAETEDDETGDLAYVAFVIFERNEENKDSILRLCIGYGNVISDKNGCKITYNIEKEIDNRLMIDNFASNLELDLWNDFKSFSYIGIERTPEILAQVRNILHIPYEVPRIPAAEQEYTDKITYEKHLHSYSQLNKHCIRPIMGHGNYADKRGEFQRDYERIIHTKAYRRLVDKAQIFSASRGDYYRTRMTHTLEVAQIARAIAIGLRLHPYLTEAIALAHDLGHTPFGHQGERTLDEILKGQIKLLPAVEGEKNFYGGFKHNFQTLRIVNHLEERHLDFTGIDLSYQVLEGALKHTKTVVKNCGDCPNTDCSEKCYDIDEFLQEGDPYYLFLEYSFPTTLEGQIVVIADEIAQRSHDLDDAFSAKLLTAEDFTGYLSLRKMSLLNDSIKDIEYSINEFLEKNRQYVDIEEFRHGRIVSAIIDFFINDVIEASLKNMEYFNKDKLFEKHHRFSRPIVSFSKNGNTLCEYVGKIISKKVINSLEVVQFDNRAKRIVSGLFKEYYNNPKLLHKGTLRRIFIDTNDSCENAICFQTCDHNIVNKEIEMIINAELLYDFRDKGVISNEDVDNYEQKRKILVRSIADFISGMTDSYAANEFDKITGN